MSKFKVGDKVRCNTKYYDRTTYEHWGESYKKVFTISACVNGGYKVEEDTWWWIIPSRVKYFSLVKSKRVGLL